MDIDRLLQEQYAKFDRKIVVLDDDPTGSQTVHDIHVYTDWTQETLDEAFGSDEKLFYILTNSRSFTAEQTKKVHQDIAAAIRNAFAKTGKDYLVISRSDSTLRGHFPLETEVLRASLGKDIDGEVLCPFFPEGGRYTIGDIHYVKQGDTLVPAAETEFAKDATFGYTKSDLKEYVEEKTGGAYKAADVVSIGLDELRAQDVDSIVEKLMSVHGFGKIVVNSEDYDDLKVFCYALYLAMGEGRQFIIRSAAGIVKTLGCIDTKPYLTRDDLVTDAREKGGLILIGSHMKKTTAQLEALKQIPGIDFIEFDSDLVLRPEAFEQEKKRVQAKIDSDIEQGTTVCVYERSRAAALCCHLRCGAELCCQSEDEAGVHYRKRRHHQQRRGRKGAPGKEGTGRGSGGRRHPGLENGAGEQVPGPGVRHLPRQCGNGDDAERDRGRTNLNGP